MNLLHSHNLLLAGYGLTAVIIVWIVWQVLLDSNPMEARLRAVNQRRRDLAKMALAQPSRRAKEKKKRSSFVKRLLSSNKTKRRATEGDHEMRLKLLRAGYRSRDAVTIFMFVKLAMMIGLGCLVFFFIFITGALKTKAALGIIGVAAGALFGWVLPGLIVKNKSMSRRNIFRKALPDALDLLVICAEAGLSLDAALDRVAREIAPSYPELAEEFALTSVELGLLPERSKALQNLTERVDLQGVLSLVNTLIQTERYGTPLAQALRVLASEMRDERMMKAEEKAARLPAIMTVPMILFILPTLFIIIIGPAAIKVIATMAGH
ncbi:MAG: type II secretion system F family protein [Alphaproteobacteria bacterium]